MTSSSAHRAEVARVAELTGYHLTDAPVGEDIAAVVRLAAVIAGVPNATLNLIDADHQHQPSAVGFAGSSTPRRDSMCAVHFTAGRFVEVADARDDDRFAANPWVDGRIASLRFYASAPLVTERGYALGSLCVFDTGCKQLDAQQVASLQDLAQVLVSLVERRRQARLSADLAAEASQLAVAAEEQRWVAELAMAEAEARFELSDAVAETIDVGLVVADPDGRLSSLNRAARQWHGLDADTSVDPADHGTAYALFAADGITPLTPDEIPLHLAIRDGSVAGVEIVIAPSGQSPRTLICSGRAMTRADGTALGAVVAMTDVTADRARETALATMASRLAEQTRELAQRHQRLETLSRASRDLLTSADPWEAICRAACDVSGADGAHLLQPDAAGNLVSTAMVGLVAAPLRLGRDSPSAAVQAFDSALPHFVSDLAAQPLAARRLMGALGVASCAWQPVLATGGGSVAVLGVVWHEAIERLPVDVPAMLQTLASEASHAIERADLLTRLAEAADSDALTGLANRRRWDHTVALEVARAQRTGAPLTLALVDLDHFKRYNDSHGHLAGDDLLRRFSAAARDCLRGVDTLARWGGEEFIIALPACTAEQAKLVADRIRGSVPDGQSCTVGLAQWTSGESVEALTARADRALYDGKAFGRDVTVLALA